MHKIAVKWPTHVCFGSLADIWSANCDVRFTYGPYCDMSAKGQKRTCGRLRSADSTCLMIAVAGPN
jgi:hypothetical protein